MATLASAMERLAGRIEADARGRRARLDALRAHTLEALGRHRRERQAVARQICEARRLWSTLCSAPPRAEQPAGECPVGPQKQHVLAIIQAHPDGVRLVDIGNEIGVDWRSLIGIVRDLLGEQLIGKLDHRYYPMQE